MEKVRKMVMVRLVMSLYSDTSGMRIYKTRPKLSITYLSSFA